MIDIKNYIIAIIAFTFIIVGGTVLMATWFDGNTDITSNAKYQNFNVTFNKLSSVNQSVSSLETGITDAKPEPTSLGGVLGGLINSAWNGLKLIFSSFSFMTSGFNGLSSIFGFPAWIPVLISLIVVVTIVFAIWMAFFKL